MTAVRHEAGSTLIVREVLHGQPWLEFPEEVVSDTGPVLATVLRPGATFSFFDHPVAHPWGHLPAWGGTTVLKLRREGEWYSVWKFFDGPVFAGWYVNFESPVVRHPDRVDVNDLELDLVVAPDGTPSWKDVEALAPSLEGGRISLDELLHVLTAAAEVKHLLECDERWWAPWDDWVPASDGRIDA